MSVNAIGSNMPIEIACGGTNNSTMANTNGMVYFDGIRLNTTAVGSATQVLTSNGTGNAPTFQVAPLSGSMVLIQSQSVNNGSACVFNTGITTQYRNFMILYDSLVSPSILGTFQVQLSVNGGSSYLTSGYASLLSSGFAVLVFAASVISSGQILLSNINSGTSLVGCCVTGTKWNLLTSTLVSNATVYIGGSIVANALRLNMSDGNNFSGNFSLYGFLK